MQPRRILIIFIFFLALRISSFSQFTDSLKLYMSKSPWISGGFGSVQTFFYGFKAPIGYVSLGLSFSGRVRMGFGYCKLKVPAFDGNFVQDQVPFYVNRIFTNTSGVQDTVNSKMHFDYGMAYLEYVFYKTKHWAFSVPLRFGIGQTKYKYFYNGTDQFTDKRIMFIYHPSVSFDYAIFRWLGLNTQIGYKFTVVSLKDVRDNFNSPVFNIGLFLYYSEIYKMCFPNTRLAKKL